MGLLCLLLRLWMGGAIRCLLPPGSHVPSWFTQGKVTFLFLNAYNVDWWLHFAASSSVTSCYPAPNVTADGKTDNFSSTLLTSSRTKLLLSYYWCPFGAQWCPLCGFSWNVVFGVFTNFLLQVPVLAAVEQNYQTASHEELCKVIISCRDWPSELWFLLYDVRVKTKETVERRALGMIDCNCRVSTCNKYLI
jgi:hypothetical protein